MIDKFIETICEIHNISRDKMPNKAIPYLYNMKDIALLKEILSDNSEMDYSMLSEIYKFNKENIYRVISKHNIINIEDRVMSSLYLTFENKAFFDRCFQKFRLCNHA
ncbi:hypothetical protein BC351_01345 [Paenibacillus ferrarius]|uniref:Uncharacterized protein n=1 Tax=Paenibacillus ferrarius TaxID=1469647 RepID=A0A1V4HSJ3_9BACL|nr:hypothetical protein [Paenibacillus ferrarius]OPH61914.1 hypothetical protein BC351_01345 [Paenibacillus ferrarius]